MMSTVSTAARLAANYVSENNDLAPLPFFIHLLRAFVREDSGVMDLRAIIAAVENEPMVAAKLIAYAQSAYYGSLSTATVASAIHRLGEQKARRVLLALSLGATFKPSSCSGFDLKEHWISAVYTACVAVRIGDALTTPDVCSVQSSHEWYTIGLLHNIGLRCLVQYEPKAMSAMLASGDLCRAEYEQWGFDHFDLGGALLAHWGLPEKFSVALPHIPDTTYRGPYWGLAAVIDVARSQSPGGMFNAEHFEILVRQWGLSLREELVIGSDEADEALNLANMVLS